MSSLIAIAYPNEDTARKAISTLGQLQKQELVRIQDAIIATHEGDKVKLDQSLNLTRAGALGGAVWGGLIGLIFLMPVVGAAIGAAAGALSGKVSDFGINDNFARELAAKVSPGKAALIVLAQSSAPDRVVEEMKKHNLGGELLYTNLSAADEQRLRESVSQA
jgi:uncharacterized membrane protein